MTFFKQTESQMKKSGPKDLKMPFGKSSFKFDLSSQGGKSSSQKDFSALQMVNSIV